MLTGLDGGRCPQVLHGTRVWYHDNWREDLAELGLADMANWRVPVDVPSVSSSKYVIACYRITLASGRVIYYKRYDYRTRWKAAIRFWLRPSKAAVEKWGYRRYQACGVAVPLTVACGESRFLGLLRVAFIITEEVPHTVSLDDFVAAGLPGVEVATRISKMNAFAGRLIDSICKAHSACVFHYDLKWRNILVQCRGRGVLPGVYRLSAGLCILFAARLRGNGGYVGAGKAGGFLPDTRSALPFSGRLPRKTGWCCGQKGLVSAGTATPGKAAAKNDQSSGVTDEGCKI